jgi:cysteine desulfurase / selenocysteine lyase
MKNLNHKDDKRTDPLLDLAGSMTEQEADDFLNSIYECKYDKKCAKCNRQLYNHYPNLRSQFPILKTQLNGHDLIYLDSAATSQKPQQVIEAMTDFYSNHNASSHSVHSLGGWVTEMVEETRQVVADFIGAYANEIVFTSCATEGINLIANGFLEVSLRNVADLPLKVNPVSLETASPLSRGNLGLTISPSGTRSFDSLKMTTDLVEKFRLNSDSEILICIDQHHSNILPWQRLAELVGCKIVFFGVLASGRWDMLDFESKLNINTKVIAISNVSNVLGIMQDVGELNEILEMKLSPKVTPVSLETSSPFSRGNLPTTIFSENFKFNRPIIVLDATQAVSHFIVDVKELVVDFLVFSGHKIYGPTGVGVLYGKKELLEVLPNYKVGGDMVESVTLRKNVYKESPFRFEAGTANFGSIIGLKAALNWFIRSREEIFEVEKKLLKYLIEKLSEVEGLEILVGIETQNLRNPRWASPATPFTSGNLGLAKSHSGMESFACRVPQFVGQPMVGATCIVNNPSKIPLVSFNIKCINSFDLAVLLDQKGICIRSGQHCAGILHEFLTIDSSCRISLGCFNTFEEINLTVESIKNVIKQLL